MVWEVEGKTCNPLSVSWNHQQNEQQSTIQLPLFWFEWTFHDYFGEPLYTLLWPWRFEKLTHMAACITQQFETKPTCAISTAFFSELKNGIISATKISITGDVVVIFATYFRRECSWLISCCKGHCPIPREIDPRSVCPLCLLSCTPGSGNA